MQVGDPRTKENTSETLRSMFAMAKQVRNQTKIKELKTATGVKDTYFEHFMDSMSKSHNKASGTAAKQAALSDFAATLPSDVFSPVWRIKGRWLVF